MRERRLDVAMTSGQVLAAQNLGVLRVELAGETRRQREIVEVPDDIMLIRNRNSRAERIVVLHLEDIDAISAELLSIVRGIWLDNCLKIVKETGKRRLPLIFGVYASDRKRHRNLLCRRSLRAETGNDRTKSFIAGNRRAQGIKVPSALLR